MSWQPISTVPKDGSRVLVWSSGTGQWPVLARWVPPDDRLSRLGGYLGLFEVQLGVPTHWAPLPSPPEGA